MSIEELEEEASIAYYETGAYYEGETLDDFIERWIADFALKQALHQ